MSTRASNGRLRIGVIAPELFDRPGGMPEYARQLATALARTDDVIVFAPQGERFADEAWRCAPVLERTLRSDGARLARERVDVWFACNAALVALAPTLRAPLVTYLNGNDVLNPWLTFTRPWLEQVDRLPLLWRTGPWLRRHAAQRDVRRGLRHAASLVANSRSTAELVDRVHPGYARKVRVIPPGVADEFFQTRNAVPADAPLRLLTVARLESWTARKNVDGVLRALRMLPHDLPVHYTVVGDGDDRRRLEELAQELGLKSTVTFAGAVPRAELIACYRDADLFVMCSRARTNDIEGFGIVYLEAAAAGVPSLCSRAGGATDAVLDGETGIILEDAGPHDIAAGIVRFAKERHRFDASRVRAFAEHFRWTEVAQRVRTTLTDARAA